MTLNRDASVLALGPADVGWSTSLGTSKIIAPTYLLVSSIRLLCSSFRNLVPVFHSRCLKHFLRPCIGVNRYGRNSPFWNSDSPCSRRPNGLALTIDGERSHFIFAKNNRIPDKYRKNSCDRVDVGKQAHKFRNKLCGQSGGAI